MIDWGLGLYLGLKLGFILIVLAIEFYFLVFDKYTEGEIGRTEFLILSATAVLCIVIPVVQVTKFTLGLWPVIPVPLFYGIFRIMENVQIEKADSKSMGNDIRNLEKVIAKKPEIPETYVELGDVYFKQGNYAKALECYRKSCAISETAELQQKIKIAEKERKIQKGEIWVCGECGTDNPGLRDECRACGNSNKLALSIKKDIEKNKDEIKKMVVTGFAVPLGAIFLLVFLKTILPSGAFLFFSICISIAVIYFLLRKFFTW